MLWAAIGGRRDEIGMAMVSGVTKGRLGLFERHVDGVGKASRQLGFAGARVVFEQDVPADHHGWHHLSRKLKRFQRHPKVRSFTKFVNY